MTQPVTQNDNTTATADTRLQLVYVHLDPEGTTRRYFAVSDPATPNGLLMELCDIAMKSLDAESRMQRRLGVLTDESFTATPFTVAEIAHVDVTIDIKPEQMFSARNPEISREVATYLSTTGHYPAPISSAPAIPLLKHLYAPCDEMQQLIDDFERTLHEGVDGFRDWVNQDNAA